MITESTTDEQRVTAMSLNNFLLLGVGALGALIGGEIPQFVGASCICRRIVRFRCAGGALGGGAGADPGAAALRASGAATAGDWVDLGPAIPLPQGEGEIGALAMAAASGGEGLQEAASPADLRRMGDGAAVHEAVAAGRVVYDGRGGGGGAADNLSRRAVLFAAGSVGHLVDGAGLVGGATSLLAPRLVQRWGRLKLATGMQFASIPAILGIGFLPLLPLVALAEFVRQILRGVFEPVYVTFAMERVSARMRGTLSGFYSLTWSVGYSIGPVTAGFLQTNVGLSASFVIGAVLVGGSATLLRVFFPRA